MPKVAIAYAGTYAMGRGLTAWALGGVEVTADSLSRYTAEGLDKGRQIAQQLIAQVKVGCAVAGRAAGSGCAAGCPPGRRGHPSSSKH